MALWLFRSKQCLSTTGLGLGIGASLSLALLHLSSQMRCVSSSADHGTCAEAKPALLRQGYHPYALLSSEHLTPDTKLLRFELPPDMRTLGAPPPSCVKVKHSVVTNTSEMAVLDKSYSPVSLPNEEGTFELLVKGYPPRPAGHPAIHGPPGGLGAFLVGMNIGDTAQIKIKEPRKFHGELYRKNRWTDLGFIAGGTGIAPMLQMIRAILADPEEETRLSLVFANRHEDDIIMRPELDGFARDFPERFRVRYVLSSPPERWAGGTGWVSAEDCELGLHAPRDGTMVLVSGRDEFLETVSGMTTRAPPPQGKKKGPKIQGELRGALREAGFSVGQVYKF